MTNPSSGEVRPEDDPGTQRHNFIATTIYQVLLRMGWIFKTESVIMPAALDSMGGNGWVRGCLPMLNRIGQSLPPLLVWPLVRSANRQRNWLAVTTCLMGLCFCLMAGLWATGLNESAQLAQCLFLVIYTLFFVATGINQLTLSSLIGKLIRADLRGRLMLAANTFGCLVSITCAWFVLRHWLGDGDANFAAIFATSGLVFLIAGASALLIQEPVQQVEKQNWQVRRIFGEVWQTCADDKAFRMVVYISALFGLSMTLMPHYQNMARVRLNLGFSDLLPWLIIQNFGVAVFSVPIGSLADRLGNRAALRVVLGFLLAAPVLALVFSRMPEHGRGGFLFVYFLLGLMPVTMRLLSNFSLEFSATENQPRYLATQSIAMAVPVIVTSTLIGWALDHLGYEVVFGFVICCIALALCLTFRVSEPRNDRPESENG